jgi:hypothetical protein
MYYTWDKLKELVAERIADPTGARSLRLAENAIAEVINELNSQRWWHRHHPGEDITLVVGQKEYSLTDPVARIDFAWLLNSERTRNVKPIPVLHIGTFIRCGFYTDPNVGQPNNITYNEETDKIRLDRSPTTEVAGRGLRIAYYTRIPQIYDATDKTTQGIDDPIMGGLIVECATPRIRRNVEGYDWVTDLKFADREKMRVRSMVRSTDKFAVGRS